MLQLYVFQSLGHIITDHFPPFYSFSIYHMYPTFFIWSSPYNSKAFLTVFSTKFLNEAFRNEGNNMNSTDLLSAIHYFYKQIITNDLVLIITFNLMLESWIGKFSERNLCHSYFVNMSSNQFLLYMCLFLFFYDNIKISVLKYITTKIMILFINFMLKEQIVKDFLLKYDLQYVHDNRSGEAKAKQKEIVSDIFARNLTAFRIELSNKKSVKYTPSKLMKVQFEDGWYCNITDNNVVSQQTILTMHGAPGNHIAWAGLQTQMKNKHRWVNFIIPGFDGQDERRGTYNGLREDLFLLIFKLIEKLKLRRITLCFFSFGTSIAYDLISRYPSAFEGFVNVAGLCNFWSYGTILTYKIVVAQNNYYDEQWKMKKEYENDEQRQAIYKKYIESYDSNNYREFSTPFFQKPQFFAFYKLTYKHPKQFEQLFKRIRQLQFFRVNLYSVNDQFHISEKIESTIYALILGEQSYLKKPYYQKLFFSMKKPLEERLFDQFGIQICGDEIQSYFCFRFEDTGHAIHRRRPVELSRIISIYLSCLQVKHTHENLINSKL